MPQSRPRYRAIDVLRGLTVALMIVVNMSVGEGRSYAPLLHAAWDGLTLADLVFPTFLFVVGAALSFTLGEHGERGDNVVLRKIAVRTSLIFLCGVLLNWFPFVRPDAAGQWVPMPVSGVRVMGVLQRIALAYGCAALIVHLGGRIAALLYAAAALLGYWWVLHAFGDYSLTGNIVLKVDTLALGAKHLYHGEGVAFDPEGILSTFPSVVNVLGGYLAGRLLRERGATNRSIGTLTGAGAVLIAVALVWNGAFPINKKLWTSSYVLCTVGADLMVFGVLAYLVDRRGQRRWTYPFEVLGRNALAVYLLSEVGQTLLDRLHIGGEEAFDWLYENLFQSWADDKPASLAFGLCYLLACWLVACAMDRRRIYWRL